VNLFALDPNPRVAAAYHSDIHVISQIKEGAQILCFALERLGIWTAEFGELYAPNDSHVAHPCCVWAAQTAGNFQWAYDLTFYLNVEYVRRSNGGAYPTGKGKGCDHASAEVADRALAVFQHHRPVRGGLTSWAQALPEDLKCQIDDDHPNGWHVVDHPVVLAYRAYYLRDKAALKNRSATWTTRGCPSWWTTTHNSPEKLFDPDELW